MSEFVFFYGGCFSQWYRCSFEIDGVRYNCAEQFMMTEKARLFNDEGKEKQIMAASHPRDQKRFGREVSGFVKETWDAVAKDIVYRGNHAKFSQNPVLLEELLATKGKLLVEASPTDVVWGIGLGMDDPLKENRENWRGTNWLGEVLTKLRDDLLMREI